MFEENKYIPFQSSHLPKGAWLVLAPHADDETFGMGGAILMATHAGQAVDVIILTDGALGGNLKDLSQVRKKEAHAAMLALGVRQVEFMNHPDRSLSVTPALIDELSRRITVNEYSSVFFPSPVEPHPDHRTTAQLAWEALRKAKFKSLPITYEISLQGPCNTLIDISSVMEEKRTIMRLYASQLEHNNYIERITGLNASRTWSLPMTATHAEAFYIWEKENKPLASMLWKIQKNKFSNEALPEPLKLVSIIIRTVQRPKFLREAIRSVATQNYPYIEIIVINDGDNDLSELVHEEATGSIVTYQYMKNEGKHGRSIAGNIGLKHAKGEYIGFLDDDDWLLPNHINLLVDALDKNPSAPVAYSGVDCIKTNNGNESVLYRFNDPFDSIRLAYNNFIPIHSALFRTAMRNKGCQLDETLDMYEDWHFWLQLSHYGDFIHIEEVTAKYRMGEDGGTGLPTLRDDTTKALDNFVNASRMIWSTKQLRHLCLLSHKGFVESKKREGDGALEKSESLDNRSQLKAERLEDLISKLNDYERHIKGIQQSLSWRLTKPLREIKRIVTLLTGRRAK